MNEQHNDSYISFLEDKQSDNKKKSFGFKRLYEKIPYAKMIAYGYIFIILIGALLLMLPFANNGNTPNFLDAVFTATSATCVTGLVVFDTFTQWSLFGQIVILILIQIGGLGFMTIITMFSFMLKKRIGLKTRGILQQSVSSFQIGGVVKLFKKVLIGTFIVEGIGALILFISFNSEFGIVQGLYFSIFHSVSAFCNAGFDLMGMYGEYSSLTPFANNPLVILTISALIIVGGIGFFVWDDIVSHKLDWVKYKLHTKIVLVTSLSLIIGGTLLFFMLEYDNTLADMSLGEKVLTSFFCSVTPRTAGFNSIDNFSLATASKLLCMILMFIGGSPGSTAGGIKTTTFAVMLMAIRADLQNKKDEECFKKRLEPDTVRKATAMFSTVGIIMLTASLLIMWANPEFTFEAVLFETVSAIGTVGLSTGITPNLNILSKIIIMLLMYCGRVGSITFAMLFTEEKRDSSIRFISEKISIG